MLIFRILIILCAFLVIFPVEASRKENLYKVTQMDLVLISLLIEEESKFCYDHLLKDIIIPSLSGDKEETIRLIQNNERLHPVQKEACLVHYYAILKRFIKK